MITRKVSKLTNINEFWLDLSNWPTVLFDNLVQEEQELFLRRKKAVDMYVKNEHMVKDIASMTGLSRHEIQRLVNRCLLDDGDGKIWGYRALIPQKRVDGYTRFKALADSSDAYENYAGAFKQLLDIYPNIKDKIIDYFLQRRKDIIIENQIRVKHLHNYFIKLCRTAGIQLNQYPFTTKDMAKRSLYRFVKQLEQLYFSKVAQRYGDEAARHARSTGIGERNHPVIERPYQRVQFDGHRIDAMISLTYTLPSGEEITEVLDRIWLLVIIDVATTAIIGYHLCLNREYSSYDVLHCIKNAIVPKKPKEFKIPGLNYPEGMGYPSLVLEETKWALWDEFLYDNAKANLASIVIDRLTQFVGCSVNAGPVSMPERRAFVERFFRFIEDNGYQRLPSTTGSNPDDPKRKNPEKKAIEYKINAAEIEELTEIFIARYNLTQHAGSNNLTPLDCMQQRILKGNFPRVMPPEQQNEICFFLQKVQRNVVGDIKSGRRPYINYEGVEYRNDVLSRSPNLIGTKLDLLVNIDDIRILRAYLPDGSEFGLLTATGKWGLRAHSLKTRKVINNLRDNKEIDITVMDDPIDIYQRYLESKSKKSKAQRNKLAELRRRKETEDLKLEGAAENVEIKKGEIMLPQFSKSVDPSEILNLKFKTITY